MKSKEINKDVLISFCRVGINRIRTKDFSGDYFLCCRLKSYLFNIDYDCLDSLQMERLSTKTIRYWLKKKENLKKLNTNERFLEFYYGTDTKELHHKRIELLEYIIKTLENESKEN
jgi:hypothetical protein